MFKIKISNQINKSNQNQIIWDPSLCANSRAPNCGSPRSRWGSTTLAIC